MSNPAAAAPGKSAVSAGEASDALYGALSIGSGDPSRTIYLLNGPNLNLLGVREPETYGTTTLADIERNSRRQAAEEEFDLVFRQTNHEGVMIDWIQEAREHAAGIIINPAGFTSVSIPVLDALLAADLPIVEVHLTNIHRREEWRHMSYVSKAANAVIAGAGPHGYELAVQHMARIIK